MAITAELLNANPALAALPEDQKTLIAELSANDEEAVMRNWTRNNHEKLEADVLRVSGLKKITKENGEPEKAYEYAVRAIEHMKGNAGTVQQQLDEAIQRQQELETAIANSDNSGAVNDLTKRLNDATTLVDKLRNDFASAQTNYATELQNLHLSYALNGAASNLKLREDIPQNLVSQMVEGAMSKIRTTYKPEVQKTDTGGHSIVFRDQNGDILTNPNNMQKPYTPAELLSSELKDLLAPDRQQQGGGTGANQSTGGNDASVDISSARTQVDATKLIEATLFKQGLTKTDEKFSEEFDRLWKENEVNNLPIRQQ